VTDWVQEGRLLEDDKLRPSGTGEWHTVGSLPAFVAYLPRSEPHRVEDEAEALEPVQLDFAWKRKPEGDEGDVDMIPLIDISLVLLIFFIMTTTSVAASWFIKTPSAQHGWYTNNPELVWIGMDLDSQGDPIYSLGQGDKPPADEHKKLTQKEVLQHLDVLLRSKEGPVEVTIKAHEDTRAGDVRKLILELERPERRDKIIRKYAGVSENP
jgi:biopolymer transport protein ExbD